MSSRTRNHHWPTSASLHRFSDNHAVVCRKNASNC
jgi:hypothetical protein